MVNKKRVNPNIQDNDECTPLWISGYNNQYSSAQILLWGGANLSIKGKSGGTALCKPSISARSQRNPSVAEVIETEEDLRVNDDKRMERFINGEGGGFEEYRTEMKEAITRYKTKNKKY
ncbi:hypothetical protein TL16_g12952 [Triparma laevis f. inornata]|uniref:Uncharacterized protein n=1 Tax=Triparma laevis f. inornata TaxID=1714386 RepID=A0A9W7BVV7_9STRA|nr:hypothetical protein TL16_g12952 [Triparma laevis f. inornata]